MVLLDCGQRGRRGSSTPLAQLPLNPKISRFQARAERQRGLPTKLFPNETIVRIAPADPERPVDMPDPELLAGYVHRHRGKLVNRHHFVGSDVDWAYKVRDHQALDALDA